MTNPALQPVADDTTRAAHRKGVALAALPLYIGFAATGVGVALPGALLPALLLRWGLHDEQGGRLFLMAFIGASLGSLVVHGSLRNSLLLGSMAVVAGSVGLALCPSGAAFGCILLYGLGLGLAMTSINLIRQRQSGGSGTVLVRLNLFWALGAFACPSLTVSALRTGDIRPVLFGLALCFVLLTAWTLFQPDLPIEPSTREGRPWAIFRSVPAGLILMTILVPGVEASAGGWLATYAKRGGHGIAAAVAAPSCFWAGLLLSRLFWSTYSRWRSAEWTVRASVLLMAVASILLIASGSGLLMLIAAFCLGFGIGPVYPLLLAWALRFHRSGAIFFLAGVGASSLPWLTGFVSSQRQSLSVGLAVPMSATILLAVMSLLLPLKLWSKENPPH
ncbi:MAG: MFS transporter [Acidobacteriota bacterium]|nr:MFS transporter [Acidobacteriota bacterium]